jgi:hypothetical protein
MLKACKPSCSFSFGITWYPRRRNYTRILSVICICAVKIKIFAKTVYVLNESKIGASNERYQYPRASALCMLIYEGWYILFAKYSWASLSRRYSGNVYTFCFYPMSLCSFTHRPIVFLLTENREPDAICWRVKQPIGEKSSLNSK